MLIHEAVALSVYLSCFILYHLVYFSLTKRKPSLTKKGRINRATESWLSSSLEDGQQLLIVHQIRNMIISITFLASTAVILIGFLFNYGVVGRENSTRVFAIKHSDYPGWLALFTITLSLVSLLLALRHFNNLSILIKSSPERLSEIEGTSALQYLEKLYISGSQHYMIGRRGFLYTVVTLFWYINTWLFVTLVLALTFTLSYRHDF